MNMLIPVHIPDTATATNSLMLRFRPMCMWHFQLWITFGISSCSMDLNLGTPRVCFNQKMLFTCRFGVGSWQGSVYICIFYYLPFNLCSLSKKSRCTIFLIGHCYYWYTGSFSMFMFFIFLCIVNVCNTELREKHSAWEKGSAYNV